MWSDSPQNITARTNSEMKTCMTAFNNLIKYSLPPDVSAGLNALKDNNLLCLTLNARSIVAHFDDILHVYIPLMSHLILLKLLKHG